MQSVIEAVRAERELLLAPIADRLATLDEIERLAGGGSSTNSAGGGSAMPAEAPAKPKPVARRAAPRKPAATGNGLDGLGVKAQRVLEVLHARKDWMAVGDIAQQVGSTSSAANKYLRLLGDRKLVEAQGATKARRYRALDGNSHTHTTFGQGREPKATNGNARPTYGERQRIVALIETNQGDLNDERIARALKLDRDTVSEHTCVLLDKGRIRLMGGGTYALPAKAAA